MVDDFLVARNPDGDSSLPFLLRIPLGEAGIILKARDSWPRTAKIYCHQVDAWPAEPEIIERVAVRRCARRGAAIDLVLDRGRENRSQIVITNARGRQMIFWQTARTAKQARPAVSPPRARASGLADLEIVVDSNERYAYSFADRQASVVRARLPAGDYGVRRDGELVAAVERKSLVDLVSSLTSGRLRYQLSDLAALPLAAVVVEDRYSGVFKLDRVRPATVADALAECQVRWPHVPIVFCETRPLAQEWVYRFLAAALVAGAEEQVGLAAVDRLSAGSEVPAAAPTPAEVRAWARAQGLVVSAKGRIPGPVRTAYDQATGRSSR